MAIVCECGIRTGNGDGAVISRCPFHVQGLLLPYEWQQRLPRLPERTPRDTVATWETKMRRHRGEFREVLRAYDQERKKEAV